MSSLKDIMDVDVEPLQSQAYRRAQETAQQQITSSSSNKDTSISPSSSLGGSRDHTSSTRRPTNRVSKGSGIASSSSPSTTRPNIVRRRSSATGDAMDFTGYQTGGSNQASNSGSPPQSSSRSSEPTMEVPVKYTPVTGRVSRAKKGVPVHTCGVCRPVKTFTRAEHLRRHQLSHQKPAYPCNFRDCERAFHRPDLLARHVQRHETQDEQPSGQLSTSPGPSRGQSPSLKLEPPSQIRGQSSTSNQNKTSPTDSEITPRTSSGEEGGLAAFSSEIGTFQPVNYSPSASHKRSADEAQLPESDPYSAISPATSRSPANYNQLHNFQTHSRQDGNYERPSQQSFPMFEGSATAFGDYLTPQQALPTLRIPEQNFFPGLSQTQENSPWCSSATDSTYSTQSDGSRSGHWSGQRGRSGSNAPEWPTGIPQYSSHGIIGTPQDLRNPQFDSTLMDHQYDTTYTPPQMTPPMSSRQLLDVPNAPFVGYYMDQPIVGNPALTTYNKPLAQIFSASSIREPRLGGIDGRQKMEASQQLGALSLDSDMADSYESTDQDSYMASYWKSFHELFPIIHRGTFDHEANDLLTKSMVAIGTQYHNSIEARQRGMELNEECKKSIDHHAIWDLQTMQAIVLIEVFARFRGRKTTVRLSKHFEELYKRLLTTPPQTQSPYPTYASVLQGPTSAHFDQYNLHTTTPPRRTRTYDLNREWLAWVDKESRRRLLCFCFIFDVYQSIYQEQSRSKAHLENMNAQVYFPCDDTLWRAPSASQWKQQRNDFSTQVYPLNLIEQDVSGQFLISRSFFSQILQICFLASRLPPRTDRHPNVYHPGDIPTSITNMCGVFPDSALVHTFLSLHYTPLHDLLAIAGDTWVFARKITPPAAFPRAQNRLRAWSSTLAAAAATRHACNFLASALSQPCTSSSSSQVQTFSADPFCLSNYWALYTSALICWAFGHHRQQSYPSISRSSSSTAINTSELDTNSPDTPVADEDRLRALTYINGMLELSVEDLLTNKANMRGDTAGVIDSVRIRLEQIGKGGKVMNIVDAIDVLKKLNQGGRARFF